MKEKIKTIFKKLFSFIFTFLITYFLVALLFAIPFRSFIAYPMILTGVKEGGLQGIKENQYVLVDRLTYKFREPKIGELVVYKDPKNPQKTFFSRIVEISPDYVGVRGELWPQDYPTEKIPFNLIIGRIISNSFAPYLFVGVNLIIFFLVFKLLHRIFFRRYLVKKSKIS